MLYTVKFWRWYRVCRYLLRQSSQHRQSSCAVYRTAAHACVGWIGRRRRSRYFFNFLDYFTFHLNIVNHWLHVWFRQSGGAWVRGAAVQHDDAVPLRPEQLPPLQPAAQPPDHQHRRRLTETRGQLSVKLKYKLDDMCHNILRFCLMTYSFGKL